MNEITLDVNLAKTKIDRNIYGHFSEHLGRCIYEGYWVGEDSEIPNVRGIRTDVVDALRKIKVPSCAGPAAVSPTSITGWTASARANSGQP